MKYKIGTLTEINAPLERVWEVLADFPKYLNWNPITPRIVMKRKAGGRYFVRRKISLGRIAFYLRSRLLSFDAPYELTWGTDLLLIRYERRQTLRWIDKDTTQHQTMVGFSGLLAPLVMRLHKQRFKADHRLQGLSLKNQVESLDEAYRPETPLIIVKQQALV
jgi:hypothetical protein